MAAAGLFGALTGPIPLAYQEYRAEHQWPMVSATIKSFKQYSRSPQSTRAAYRLVYWMEFSVLLDLSIEQCPAPMRTNAMNATRAEQCKGVYKTLETASAADAWRWGSRHPVRSKVQVHYDPAGSLGDRVFFAGESSKLVYPWKQFEVIMGIFLFAGVLFLVASRQAKKADDWESRFPDESGQ